MSVNLKAVELEHKETFKLLPSVAAILFWFSIYVSYLVNVDFRIIIIKVICCILNQDSSIVDTAFTKPVIGLTIFRLFYTKKLAAQKNSSKLFAFGLPNISTNSFSDEIVVISSIELFLFTLLIPPLEVDTAGITFVRSFSVTRTPFDT